MRTLSIYLIVLAGLLLTGCSQKELSKEEAKQLLTKEIGYPLVYDYDIFCGDPQYAKKVLDKGLEADGLVIVHRTAKLKDLGKIPIIEFTEKAKPFFLPTPDEDRQSKIQKVKIGDEDILEIKSIVSNAADKTALVEYTTTYKNLTPFSVLVKRVSLPEIKKTAAFVLSDEDGWRLIKR